MGSRSIGNVLQQSPVNLLTILATLALAGCGAGLSLPVPKERNDFKGKPLSAVTAQLGLPDYKETTNGQTVYRWRRGTALQECRITAVMAGDIVESYDTFGDAAICSPYEAPRAN